MSVYDLILDIKGGEIYDETSNTFYHTEPVKLTLRHSLKAVSMWEAIHKEPFLEKNDTDNRLTAQETLDYIKCMTISPENVVDSVYMQLTKEDMFRIKKYLEDSMTATTFNEKNIKGMGVKNRKKEVITSEIIYYWLIALEIPLEVEQWNFNRMMTLIRVASIKNSPGKKMSNKEILASNRAMNAQRRAKLGSKG